MLDTQIVWEVFSKDVNPRFLLPIRDWQIRIDYLPMFGTSAAREALANRLMAAAAAVIEPHEQCELRALRVEVGSDNDQVWCGTALDVPIYNFLLQMRRDSIVVMKSGAYQIRDLIQSVGLIGSMLWHLFPVDPAGAPVDSDGSLFSLGLKPTRVTTTMALGLHLGVRIGNEAQEVLNEEIFRRLANFGAETPSAFGVLQHERFLRGDIKLGYIKEIHGRPRQAWVSFEAPYNITQKTIDLELDFSTGDRLTPLLPSDCSDVSTFLVDYYRGHILNRFIPALLNDVQVNTRV